MAGPWFPLIFFVAHAVATIALSRLPFTLGAGLVFGPVTGIAVAITATTVSAALAFLLARALGDALTGRTDPALVAVTANCDAIGLVGLLVDARLGIEEPNAEVPVGSSSQA